MALFEMRPGEHTPHRMRGGLIFLAIVGAFFAFAFTNGTIPFLPEGGYNVRAVFSTGVDVRAGKTPVRVGGVNVGNVTGVTRTADGKAVVIAMHLTEGHLHLTNLATAHLYWRTLLGFQYYIQLTPGGGNRPLDGQLIPLSRTGSQVELDQVLSSLTAPARGGLQQTFSQLAAAFAPGNEAGATIDNAAPAFKEVTPGLQALQGTDPGDLTNVVNQANRLVTGLNGSDNTLADLVTQAATTFGATNAQQQSVEATLQQGPETLDQTRSTMATLYGTLGLLDPVVEALRPGARELSPAALKLDPALVQLQPLLREAQPTLVALRPALSRLSAAGRIGAPLLDRLIPTFDRLNSTLIPDLDARDPSTNLRLYETIGPTASTVEDSAKMYDANGYVQRFHALAGGANTLAFLPCNFSLSGGLNCSDVNTVLQAILGISPSTSRSTTGKKG